MNINLDSNYNLDETGEPETIEDQIKEHQAVLSGAGYLLTGEATLTSINDPAYPGAYRVWSREADTNTWVWISPEGVACQTGNPSDPG